MKWVWLTHLREEDTLSERLSNLLKVTQPHYGLREMSLWHQSSCSQSLCYFTSEQTPMFFWHPPLFLTQSQLPRGPPVLRKWLIHVLRSIPQLSCHLPSGSPAICFSKFSCSVSASASVLPMNIQDWFSLGWTGWISLQSKGLSRVFFSNTTVQKHQFFNTQLYSSTLTSIHDYWKNCSFD